MKVNNTVEPLQPVATNQIAQAQSSPKLTEPQAYFADDNVSLSINGRSALDAEQNVRGQGDGAVSLENGWGRRPPE